MSDHGNHRDLSLSYFFQGLFVRCGMLETDAVSSSRDFCDSIIHETTRTLKVDAEKLDGASTFEEKMARVMDSCDDRVEVLRVQRMTTQTILQEFFTKIKDNLTNEQVVEIAEYINDYYKASNHHI